LVLQVVSEDEQSDDLNDEAEFKEREEESQTDGVGAIMEVKGRKFGI